MRETEVMERTKRTRDEKFNIENLTSNDTERLMTQEQ